MATCPNPIEWSTSDVCAWANESYYSPNILSAFVDNEINGQTLLSLTAHEIREELGIKSLADRRRLISDINVLKGYNCVHEALKENEEYNTIKNVTVEAISNGVSYYDEAEMVVIEMQIKEVADYEERQQNLQKAAQLQTYFNSLILTDEIDAKIAKDIGNVDDRTAVAQLERLSIDIFKNKETARKNENEAIIRASESSDAGFSNVEHKEYERNERENVVRLASLSLQKSDISKDKQQCISCGYCFNCLWTYILSFLFT